MDITDYLYNINLSYDKTKLLEEMNNITFNPFNDLGPQQRGNWEAAGQRMMQRISKIPKGHWFDNPPTWLQGHVVDTYPEINKVQTQISNLLKCKDIRPRYYKQQINTPVPMHQDKGTLCAINILLSDTYGPIEFEDLGEIYYDCAILNLQKKHAVPAFSKERVLLKYSIFDVPYREALANYRLNTTGDII